MSVPFISLAKAHAELGWPTPEAVRSPPGAGAEIFAALVREKIGRALAHFDDAGDAAVSVLMADPEADSTEPPISVVVEFQRNASDATLRELHRLAWNFSHAPALITVEPELLRVWSCCEPPDSKRLLTDFMVHEVPPPDMLETEVDALERGVVRALHWINLASGEFFREHADRFDRNGRADQMLLGNLRHIRAELTSAGLQDDDVSHDLLARIIFVQFLFDRKDSEGNAALNATKLARLQADGVLRRHHKNLASVLEDFNDTYRLFDWLNTRFNGDLFPGKGNTAAARARGWAAEKRVVTKQHLKLLADFISGDLDMPTGQGCLWPLYAFDVIPLEFISSIYETFVTERAAKEGIFYTPPHLVDFVLDRVLPWNGDVWDITVLDPACGSGVFLVKAFQRLIHRWKRANPGQPMRAETLRRILERNLFGVDKDPHAVRVACFSLYLAMCDEIDPRHYWTKVVFPSMRGERLISSDFFAEDHSGFQSKEKRSYDLIIGNAPWGESLLTDAAAAWAAKHQWPVVNKDIGVLFLAKAAHLVAATGQIAIIQSANSLLFNRRDKAAAFRQKLFSTHSVEEIINLSALRFKMFKRKTHATKTSVAPACIVFMRVALPCSDDLISYVSPKHLEQLVDEFKIVIDPNDRRSLTAREAATDPTVWTALMWGGKRDSALLAKLLKYPSLAAPPEGFAVKSRKGIVMGDGAKSQPSLSGRRMLDSETFSGSSVLFLDDKSLDKVSDVRTDAQDSTDFTAFAWPQLVIKKGWQQSAARFQARLIESTSQKGVLCTQSYVTTHVPASQVAILEAACLALNSMFAAYYLMLTSGRFASYRPEALVKEMLAVPIPAPRAGLLEGVETLADVDRRSLEAFGFKDAEKVLIEDMFKFTLPDFRDGGRSVGRQGTARERDGTEEPDLTAYCQYFIRVLKAGFGQGKAISATIFQESNHSKKLPYRLIAFELGSSQKDGVKVARMQLSDMIRKLDQLDGRSLRPKSGRQNIYQQRIARVYESRSGTPTIFIVKPDMRRYWTRSAGLSDAGEVALDLFRWNSAAHLEMAAG